MQSPAIDFGEGRERYSNKERHYSMLEQSHPTAPYSKASRSTIRSLRSMGRTRAPPKNTAHGKGTPQVENELKYTEVISGGRSWRAAVRFFWALSGVVELDGTLNGSSLKLSGA